MSTNIENLIREIAKQEACSTEYLNKEIEHVVAEMRLNYVTDETLASRLKTFRDNLPANTVDEASVKTIVENAISSALAVMPPKEINVDIDGAKRKVTGLFHKDFEKVLTCIAAGVHVMCVGPKGTGKSHFPSQIKDALGRDLNIQNPCDHASGILGHVMPEGATARTPSREAFEHGHLLAIEEVDAFGPKAGVSGLNPLLGNGYCTFGNETVRKHGDFVALATANTYGKGADRVYCGRNQLDDSTLDRFGAVIYIDYDYTLERAIVQNDTWVDFVQKTRDTIDHLKLREGVSMRASINGARLLQTGKFEPKEVAQMTVWQSMAPESVHKIKKYCA